MSHHGCSQVESLVVFEYRKLSGELSVGRFFFADVADGRDAAFSGNMNIESAIRIQGLPNLDRTQVVLSELVERAAIETITLGRLLILARQCPLEEGISPSRSRQSHDFGDSLVWLALGVDQSLCCVKNAREKLTALAPYPMTLHVVYDAMHRGRGISWDGIATISHALKHE